MREWVEACSFLLFPPFCLHCKKSMRENSPLCLACLEQVELLTPQERCEYCFQEDCIGCEKKEKKAYLFSNMDPMRSVGNSLFSLFPSPYGRLFASYLLIQLERLSWPSFDQIVPTSQIDASWSIISIFCKMSQSKKRRVSVDKNKEVLQMGLFPPKKVKSSYLLTLFNRHEKN